jgi:DNA polymerase
MKNDKQNLLEKLEAKIISDKVCPELMASASRLVFGEGNASAELVFIGEAPGKKEDQTGKPFIGASGKLLNELLASIGLKRSDIYITNIVKYRPPLNRDPSTAEKAAFLPYLFQQLSIIGPKIVVTLGRHSMNCFMPGRKISEIHGIPEKIKGITYLPLYHPAAALYNGSMRQTLIDDFQKIPELISN